MNKKRITLWQLILAVLGTIVLLALAVWFVVGGEVLTLVAGYTLIQHQYVGDYDSATVIDSAMDGMVDGVGDRWSYYLTAEEYEAQQTRRANEYVGIGVVVSYELSDGLRITAVTEDGPADQAGLLVEEIIVAVDGQFLTDITQSEAVAMIQGEAGTTVTLEIMAVDGTVRSVVVTRGYIAQNPVAYTLLDGDIGYLQLANFYDNSAQALIAGVEDLTAQGATGIVFDLRNNGGGYLDELTEMLDYLLPEGNIFISVNSDGGQTEVVTSDEACVDLQMVVLVNRDSYSAAELFAAQLQESNWAAVVGEETSGKGYSQQTFQMPNGGALNISTQAYLTGGGNSLVGVGIVPDVYISLSDEMYAQQKLGQLALEDDLQFQAALAYLTE